MSKPSSATRPRASARPNQPAKHAVVSATLEDGQIRLETLPVISLPAIPSPDPNAIDYEDTAPFDPYDLNDWPCWTLDYLEELDLDRFDDDGRLLPTPPPAPEGGVQ